jgi:hypothetical protein
VACTDRRGWTCCRQMACKRSAVRARLAPLVRSEIRTDRTGSTAGKYSNGGRVGRRMCVRSGMFPRLGLLAGHRIPGADRRCPACHLGKSPPHRPGDSCHLATTQPPWRTIPASDSCRICKWPLSRWASRPMRFTPENRASWPERRVRRRQARRAGSARCAVDVSPALRPLVRCATQAQSCAVAQLFARASARWCAT